MFLFARCLQLHSSLRWAIDMFSMFFALTDTLTDKEHDSTVELSATNWKDFELLASTGEELVWKFNESFDFTVEWFEDFVICLHGRRTRVEVQRVLWFHSWVVRRFWIICLHGRRTCVKVQRVLWFHGWMIRFNERWTFWIAYSKLTILSHTMSSPDYNYSIILSHILPKPASCSRQFTQNASRSILARHFSTENNVRGEELDRYLDTSNRQSAKVDHTFSNSLIIHQVKTKKIISVKEVWIPGLN